MFPPERTDGWGHPIEIEIGADGYRLISAGSDGEFQRARWEESDHALPIDGDAVYTNGEFSRQWHLGNESAEYISNLIAVELWIEKVPSESDAMLRQSKSDRFGRRLSAAIHEGDYAGAIETWRKARAFDPFFTAASGLREMAENIDSSHPQIADLRSVLEEAGVEVPERLSESGQIRERALRVGGDVTAPVVLERVEPVLSEVARAANVSGIVILEAVIDRNGKVVDVRVLKPLGFATDSAVEAVKKWKFRPGTLDGEPVDVIFALTVNVKPPRPGDGP